MEILNVKELVEATGYPRRFIDRLKRQGRFPFFPGEKRGYMARPEDVKKAADLYMEEQAEAARKKWKEGHGIRDFDFNARLDDAIRNAKKEGRKGAKVLSLPARKRRNRKAFDFEGGIDGLLKESH